MKAEIIPKHITDKVNEIKELLSKPNCISVMNLSRRQSGNRYLKQLLNTEDISYEDSNQGTGGADPSQPLLQQNGQFQIPGIPGDTGES